MDESSFFLVKDYKGAQEAAKGGKFLKVTVVDGVDQATGKISLLYMHKIILQYDLVAIRSCH